MWDEKKAQNLPCLVGWNLSGDDMNGPKWVNDRDEVRQGVSSDDRKQRDNGNRAITITCYT